MNGVLITGVSRRRGIAAAVAARLSADGFAVVRAGWTPYDREVLPGIDEQTDSDLQEDLSDPEGPGRLLAAARARIGTLSALVLAHTYDSGGGVLDMTAATIDQHLAVSVRGSLLLMRGFVEQLEGRPGRIVIFISGPPLAGQVAYAAGKGALEWITYSAATELGPRGVTVNAINPGPNQSGWMSPSVEVELAGRTPLGRVGQPSDAAAAVSFLLSQDGGFLNGHVLNSDGGFRAAAG